ncbi:MAG: hypothetical protein HN704_16085 [Bacteroidetes bacterium]|jgi:RHS repeat-associated protein|nr:hypothetical protein [Bacteroidota bacterium]MBT7141959.1 hypothetical protein [Bacteroidota bacterium]MBT7493117.1 hypothetical protein [Bacteroidota bacterium]
MLERYKINEQRKLDFVTVTVLGWQTHGQHVRVSGVTGITGNLGTIPSFDQEIEYTAFNKVSKIDENNKILEFTYGHDRLRRKTEMYDNSVLQETKYYFGNYEKLIDEQTANEKQFHYISAPIGLFAVLTKETGQTDKLQYIHTDHLGSIQTISNESGQIDATYSYDAWGRQRNPNDWSSYSNVPSLPEFNRGYTGHEHLSDFGLINMNGRLYDPVLGRMLSPDNYVQMPGNSQNYNRYPYCLNNPLIYTDPSGEIIWMPIIIGAVIGTYMGGTLANNDYNPTNWDYSSGKTWGYMAGGAIVGGLSGYVGGAIAASEIPMANTLGIAGASYTNSVGTNIYTGGQTDVSVNLGVASYNFTSGDWGYLGKEGNSALENIGYGLGALANLADVNQLINSTQATLYTDDSDFISHSAIADKNSGDPLMSFGPNDNKTPNSKLGYATYFRKSTSDFHYNSTLPVDITVNKYAIDAVRGLGKVLPFQGITTNCVNMSSLSLWLNGIPNIGIHPYLLYGTTWAYSSGIRADLFSYYLTQY